MLHRYAEVVQGNTWATVQGATDSMVAPAPGQRRGRVDATQTVLSTGSAHNRKVSVMRTIDVSEETYQTIKEQLSSPAKHKDGMKYVICRTYSAGVFAGYLESRDGQEVVLRGARRLWYWDGAASLSQLAVDGTKTPEKCKFPVAVDKVELLQAIEILDTTETARQSIEKSPIWER